MHRTIKEIFFTFGFQVYWGLIGFIISIILARTFSNEEYGQYSIIMKYIMIMHTFGLLGLDIAGINYMSNKKIPGSVLSKHILPFSFVSGIVFFFVAWALFPIIYEFSPAINICFYAAIPFNLLMCVTCALILGSNHILSYNFSNNARDTLYIVLIVIFVIGFGGGFPTAAIMYVAATVISFLISLWFLYLFGLLSWKKDAFDRKIFTGLLSFGKYTYISDVLWFLVLRLDILMVGYFLGLKSAGIYTVASQLADIMRFLPRAISLVIIPKIPTFTPDQTKKIILLLSKSMFLILSLIFVGVYILGEKTLQITYSAKYTSAYTSLILLTPGVLFLGISQILSGYYVAKGYVKIFIPISASALIVDVILVILFVPEYGLPAAAIASSISYFVSFLVCLVYYFKKEHLQIKDIFITSIDIKEMVKVFKSLVENNGE